MTIDIRPANSRFHTQIDWLDSWHSFSFAEHHDPANTHHGLLLVSNDDVVDAGRGFGMHHHRDMEIVTWVISGQVEHRDSQGNHGVIRPGLAQRMSAGSGIMHSEMNPSATEPVRLVQMWVLPDVRGGEPGYEEADITEALGGGGLVKVASGIPDTAPITIRQRGAELWAGRLAAGTTVDVPQQGHVHVFVATGGVDLAGTPLHDGDAARLTNEGPHTLTVSGDGAEVLIWATN
jgi:redox-sensitive bicupin YhaK (pirin superfamily)